MCLERNRENAMEGRREREGEKEERNSIHSLTEINLQTKIPMPARKVNV